MGALKQKAIIMEEQKDYWGDVDLAIDMLTVSLEQTIYELIALTSEKDVMEKITKNYDSAVIQLNAPSCGVLSDSLGKKENL